LDISTAHFDYAIAAASRQGKWQEAADLFWKQISPGYNPVNVSISNPQGLRAIAEVDPKGVFEAVTQLTMVSPSDAEKCELLDGADFVFVRLSHMCS